MTKVEHTKTHPTDQATIGGIKGWVQVTDAKLVLVDLDSSDAHWVPLSEKVYISKNGRYLKPISISETEKIEDGDWVYDKFGATGYEVFQCSFAFPNEGRYYKILALPEHFSPTHLQRIVDDILKDGDKVLVECEDIIIDNGNHDNYTEFQIKLNPHITIYPVEEKMYTREEVIKLIERFRQSIDNYKTWSKSSKEWFEKNVR